MGSQYDPRDRTIKDTVTVPMDGRLMQMFRGHAERLYEKALRDGNDGRAEVLLDALTAPDGRP